MQAVTNVHGPTGEAYKMRAMRLGANWFFWVAILAVFDMLLVFYSGLPNFFWGLGVTHYVDSTITNAGGAQHSVEGLAVNLAIAGILFGFGYLARKGSDFFFILGMFLYIVDAIVLLGYRDLFAFCFHIFALFFMFKGLLASRRRYDPSVVE